MTLKEEPLEFDQAFKFYEAGDYKRAYSIMDGVAEKHPRWAQRAYEFRMDFAAKMGKFELAEEILGQALEAGFFYNEYVLRKDDDLKALQGRPRFETLVKKSFEILAAEENKSKPELIVLRPEFELSARIPFLMALHGNNSNAEDFSTYWSYFTRNGWLTALPQSSQLSGRNMHVWNDLDKADTEIKAHYEHLTIDNDLDTERSLIAGFSKGGHEAIRAALTGLFPMHGFIAIAPYVGDPDNWIEMVSRADKSKVRGVFLLGEKDSHCTPGALKLHEMLLENGFRSKVEIFEGMKHEIPDNYDKVFEESVKFLFS